MRALKRTILTTGCSLLIVVLGATGAMAAKGSGSQYNDCRDAGDSVKACCAAVDGRYNADQNACYIKEPCPYPNQQKTCDKKYTLDPGPANPGGTPTGPTDGTHGPTSGGTASQG